MASMNPQIRDLNSPLEELIMQALRRHGEFTTSTVDGDVSLMKMEFANEVLEEINSFLTLLALHLNLMCLSKKPEKFQITLLY